MKKEFIFNDELFNWGNSIETVTKESKKLNKEFFLFNGDIYIVIDFDEQLIYHKTGLTKKDII